MAAPKVTADSTIEVRSAVGRFDDFAEVVGVKKPGGGGCWCMSYRDARLSNAERPEYMARMVERSRRYLHFIVEELERLVELP